MDQKILIVYYSLEGNTEFAAKEIKRLTGADIVRLVPEKEIPKSGFGKYFFGGKAALTRSYTRLKPIEEDPKDYDTIVIAAPVWASTYPPAIGTFLNEHRLSGKDIFLVATSKSGNAGKTFKDLEGRLSGNQIRNVLSLVSPLKDQKEAQKEIAEFARSIRNEI
ncbi:MAG: flavodoxin family protein [Bilifractor sp.]|jgi:flavodoxin